MGRKSEFTLEQRTQLVLKLLSKEEPGAQIARRDGISEQTLYRWRDEFVRGGGNSTTKWRIFKCAERILLGGDVDKGHYPSQWGGGRQSINQSLVAGAPQLILAPGFDRPDNGALWHL